MSLFARRTRGRLNDALLVLQVVSYFAGFVTLALLLVQMRADARAEKARHSLDLVAQFNADPLHAHRQNTLLPWAAIRPQLQAINDQGGMPRAEIDDLVRSVVADYDQRHADRTATLSIQEVAGFFDQVKICVDEKVCDERILRPYFQGYATDFHCMYAAILEKLKATTSSGIGTGVRWLRGGNPCA